MIDLEEGLSIVGPVPVTKPSVNLGHCKSWIDSSAIARNQAQRVSVAGVFLKRISDPYGYAL